MSDIDNIEPTVGTSSKKLQFNEKKGLVAILPEFIQAKEGIIPSGRYHVYYVHPIHGSCTFIVEKDDREIWISGSHPNYISKTIISLIGENIEKKNK